MSAPGTRVWFTGDQHWNHGLMVKKRGFPSIEEMNEYLVQAWGKRVHPGDRVYVLGDVSWGAPTPFLDRVPGQLYLINGNHDSKKIIRHPRWVWAREAAYIKVQGQGIHLSHYAFETWRNSHHGSWHLHAHSHGNLAPRGRRWDVGVETHPLSSPWPFEEVQWVLGGSKFEQVDHHKEKEKGHDPLLDL